MNAPEAVELLSAHRDEIRGRFDVRELALFGSVARNEARNDSDIDVLVQFHNSPTFDRFMGLKLFLEELFGARVDLGIEQDLRPAVRSRVEREAVRVS